MCNKQTKQSMNRLVESREIHWCESDDRHVLVIKSNEVVVGLNYCQSDDYDYFVKNFSDVDEDLTKFYNAIKPYLNGGSEIELINEAIWAHFDYKND